MSLLKSYILKQEQLNVKSRYKIRIYEKDSKSNSNNGKIIDLDLSISKKNIETIIINFSKICYFLDTNNLLAIQYKKNFDLIFFKLKEIKSVFADNNNLEKISSLILYCINNNILSQLYLYIIVSKLLFDKDNTKSEQIINAINNLYSSLISSHGNYPLIIFFLSYYILDNIREILNYIDIKLACNFIRNIISKMSNSILEYKNISTKLYKRIYKTNNNNHNNTSIFFITINSNIDNLLDNECNDYIEKELNMLNDLLEDNLKMFNYGLNKMNKYIYRDEIYDALINCVLIKNKKKINEYYYNRPMLKYIIKNENMEFIVIVFDKIFKLFNKIIKKEPNLLSIINDIISDIYLFYSNNTSNIDIINEIDNFFFSSLEYIIKISKEKTFIENATLTFYLNYIKNIVFFTIQLSEKRAVEDRLNYINSILNLFLNFLNRNNKESFRDEHFFFFNIICQNLKTINLGLFPFKSLIDIISFFPEDKKIIQYNVILDEINKSQIIIDNITKVEFSLSLITKIFIEKNKKLNNDDEEEEEETNEISITESEEDMQNILKINKIILSISNEDPNELLRLILEMGKIYENLSYSMKILTSNSFYQKLINNSEITINYFISKKNSKAPQHELNLIFILIKKIYFYIQKYITNHFQYLFDDNKRIILEIIKKINDIKDKELKEKLAYIAVQFGQIYIKIILKEKALETERAREAIEQYYNMDEFDFGFEDEEEKESDDSNKKVNLKRSKSIRSQKENNIFIENIRKELSKKSELKIKNFSDSFSLVIKSTKNFVKVFTKTEIFNVIIDKSQLNSDNNKENINDSYYDEDLSRNIFDLSIKENEESSFNKIENKEEKFVPGYSILLEEFSKIKGKRVDLALIKLCLIEMYNYIKDYKKVNSLFLEVKEECSFLNNELERLGIISLISDKILNFINHNDNQLEINTINSLAKFISIIISKEEKKQNQKLEKELNNIKDKTAKISSYLKSKKQ